VTIGQAARSWEKEGGYVATAPVDDEVYDPSFGKHWWVFLITGTGWLFLSLILFRFDVTSAKSIAILAGIIFLIAGFFEFLMVAVVRSGWWKAVNAILGVLLIVGGILSFIHPKDTFVAVASITAFMFLFVGILDVIVALSNRVGVWWLRLIVGIVCIGLGFWASGDFGRSSTLLVAWVGAFALLRGIEHFLIAFAVRGVHKDIESAGRALAA
jgi:uncharacterized membrane protein HdeD (DUF308 family)